MMGKRSFSESGLSYVARLPAAGRGVVSPPTNGGIIEAARSHKCPCCYRPLTQGFLDKLLCLNCGFSVECSLLASD